VERSFFSQYSLMQFARIRSERVPAGVVENAARGSQQPSEAMTE
jgi:hypothetical protein